MNAKLLKLFTDVIDSRIESFRLGIYLAKNGAALDKFNRVAMTPDFMTDEIRNVRVVSSPLLDIEAPKDATLAIISQDGVPSAPISLGVMFSNNFKPEDQTVWIRARLNTEKGFLDIGSEKGIRILVGSKKADLKPIADGKVSIGNGTGELICDTYTHSELFESFLQKLPDFVEAVAAAKAAELAAVAAGTPAPAAKTTKDGLVETARNAIFPDVIAGISEVITNLKSLKE